MPVTVAIELILKNSCSFLKNSKGAKCSTSQRVFLKLLVDPLTEVLCRKTLTNQIEWMSDFNWVTFVSRSTDGTIDKQRNTLSE